MQNVKVKKDELLATVRKNRDGHRDLFLKAQAGYREDAIAELDRMLREARDGKKIRRGFTMPEPIDRTGDYDTVINMLEMSVDDVVELQFHEFAQYVRDQWSWKRDVDLVNMSYLKAAL
jgi:tRNA A37 N6-isopentenylltransferase MiaA